MDVAGIQSLQECILRADGDGSIDLSFRLLTEGADPTHLILAAVRAGIQRYHLDKFAPYGNHGLMAASAALALFPYAHPDLKRLAAVWAAYHSALGLKGAPDLSLSPRLPAAQDPDAAGTALVDAVSAGDAAAADGALLALVQSASETELARWFFTAACQDIGNMGHKLLQAAHLWHLSSYFPAGQRFDVLRPALHLAATPAMVDNAAALRFAAGHAPAAGNGAPAMADLEQLAETILAGQALPALEAAVRHGYTGEAVLHALLLGAARLTAAAVGDRFREGHLIAYCHAARQAWRAAGGRTWLPIVQAACLVARSATRGVPGPVPPRPVQVPELPVRALFSGQVHALETCAAGLIEGEQLPQPLVAELHGALLRYLAVQSGEAPVVIWRFKKEYSNR